MDAGVVGVCRRRAVRIALIEGCQAFANAARRRNLRFGVEQVNAAGGVKLRDGAHPLELVVLDSKGSPRRRSCGARGRGPPYRVRHARQQFGRRRRARRGARQLNARDADNRMLFLNYSADDPALTGARCSFWHFRFDAHAACGWPRSQT